MATTVFEKPMGTEIEVLKNDIEELNSNLMSNTYTTSGLVTSNCTINAGGYHKLGKLTVVNVRFTVTSNVGSITGFPTYNGQFSANIVSCSIINMSDINYNNETAFITRDGTFSFGGCTNGKSYAASVVYMCD